MALFLSEARLQGIMISSCIIKPSSKLRTVRMEACLLKTSCFGNHTRIISTAKAQMHIQQIRLLHCTRSFSSLIQRVSNILGCLVRIKFSLSVCTFDFSLNACTVGKILLTSAFLHDLLKHSEKQHVIPSLRPFKSDFSFPLKSSAILDR